MALINRVSKTMIEECYIESVVLKPWMTYQLRICWQSCILMTPGSSCTFLIWPFEVLCQPVLCYEHAIVIYFKAYVMSNENFSKKYDDDPLKKYRVQQSILFISCLVVRIKGSFVSCVDWSIPKFIGFVIKKIFVCLYQTNF